MQIIKELADGSRVTVSYETYLTDSQGPDKGNLVYLVRTKTAMIYHTLGPKHILYAPRPVKFGGRGYRESVGFFA